MRSGVISTSNTNASDPNWLRKESGRRAKYSRAAREKYVSDCLWILSTSACMRAVRSGWAWQTCHLKHPPRARGQAAAGCGGAPGRVCGVDGPAVMGLRRDSANYRLKSRGGKEPTAADQSAFDAAMLVLVALADGSVQLSSLAAARYVTDFGIDSADQIFSRDLLRNF